MIFSIKDSLLKLKERDYGVNINNSINVILENLDENQVKVLSQYQGLKIDNLIRLYFYDNVGFRCINEKDNIYGKLPICKNIEKYMNSLYSDAINEFLKDYS